jgi:hypothetical protein
MTAICWLIHEGRAYIWGDTQWTTDSMLKNIFQDKVFRRWDYVMGGCWSYFMLQLLKYKFVVPEIWEIEPMEFMCTKFIDEVRRCFSVNWYNERKDEKDQHEWAFIVWYKNRLFVIESNYWVYETPDQFCAVWTWDVYCLSALYLSKWEQPETRIRKALECASYFCPSVWWDFTIMST